MRQWNVRKQSFSAFQDFLRYFLLHERRDVVKFDEESLNNFVKIYNGRKEKEITEPSRLQRRWTRNTCKYSPWFTLACTLKPIWKRIFYPETNGINMKLDVEPSWSHYQSNNASIIQSRASKSQSKDIESIISGLFWSLFHFTSLVESSCEEKIGEKWD